MEVVPDLEAEVLVLLGERDADLAFLAKGADGVPDRLSALFSDDLARLDSETAVAEASGWT